MPLQDSILSAKKALRSLMRSQLKNSPGFQAKRSALILAQIRRHPAWATASTVALFAPLPEEPDLLGLLEDSDKRFVFPCVEGEMLVWRVASERGELHPTPHSKGRLLEPAHGELLSSSSLDCLLVPGLAFTRCGKRLGRGGGYYDRALASTAPHAIALGVCFSLQLVESLPSEPHDQAVHSVLHA
jgi:5-formyltetrahydrofolate cyclo-ligase